MARKPLIALLLVIVMVTLACGVTIPVQVKTGPTVTDEINVPFPESGGNDYVLTLSFGAGNFTLNPGARDALVAGTAIYNVSDFKPKITVNQNIVHVEQGNLKLGGIPSFEKKVRNDWDFKLADVPIRLSINAGAYTGKYELGDLSLESLTISDGAADVNLTFSNPNHVDMDVFSYNTGASSVKLTGLANAHFAEMKFRSGAGDYSLDFSGDLKFDTSVTVESGLSDITILVPVGMSARLTFEGGLTNVDAQGKWVKESGEYRMQGSGPTLTIKVKMGAGNLTLRNP
jgi:hypothetical protein